jgi:hypothetical protein
MAACRREDWVPDCYGTNHVMMMVVMMMMVMMMSSDDE